MYTDEWTDRDRELFKVARFCVLVLGLDLIEEDDLYEILVRLQSD